MRQIVLDTETTGLEPKQGHRVIEIGCVEMVDRQLTGNNFHQYLKPDREIDAGAIEVHGITNEFLDDKPRFKDVVEDLVVYLGDAELVIHNAPFDVGFLNHELKMLKASYLPVDKTCGILDTLTMARRMFPGQRASLDALCKRYEIDNTKRTLHGALLDAEILADVYLAMTGGQVSLSLGGLGSNADGSVRAGEVRPTTLAADALPVLHASDDELQAHAECLAAIEKSSGKNLWN